MQHIGTEDLPLAELHRLPGNARRGDAGAIAASVEAFGQYRSIVVRRLDDGGHVILAGNHTADALERTGYATARCDVLTCDDAEALKISLADNRLAELGAYDMTALADLLAQLDGDYVGTGWSDANLQALATRPPPTSDPDDIPDEPAEPVTQPGDVWLLGDHARLICGDWRDPAVADRLCAGAAVDLAITSPPYADRRPYDASSGFRPIPPDDYLDWFEPAAANIADHLDPAGSFMLNIKASVHPSGLDTELYVLDLVLAMVRRWGWHYATELCWERSGVPKAVTRRFKNQFEPVYQFTLGPWRTFPGAVMAKPGQATAGRFGYAFEPIYQFTRDDWKMRPEAVRHPSDDVPIPGGPGTGNTDWSARQGGNGEMFGARQRAPGTRAAMSDQQGVPSGPNVGSLPRSGDRKKRRGSFGAAGFHVDAHQGEGRAARQAHVDDWEDRAARGDIKPVRRREHGRTGAMSDAQGTPAQPGLFIGAGLAYPGNRLPTFAGTHEATGHTAAFPVGLPAWFIRAYTDRGDVVLDPFAGSGSTLIAAHTEGRRSLACEISRGYCDVIMRRFEAFTGIRPEREG